MNKLRDDLRTVRATRRSRVSQSPARVAGPILVASVGITIATLTAMLTGLTAEGVAAVAAAAHVLAAVAIRRTLGSLLAGVGLALIRPFSPGECVRIYVPELHAVVTAEIVRIGAANTTMATPRAVLVVPNSRMLRGGPAHPTRS
jgi:small-conductance mechanosensitive channel